MLAEQTLERRLKPRISVSFPVTLRGINESGQKFEVQGTLVNISASGMYVTSEKCFQVGDQIFLAVQLGGSNPEAGPRKNCLTTVGSIVRVDYAANQLYGTAVRIDSYKFV